MDEQSQPTQPEPSDLPPALRTAIGRVLAKAATGDPGDLPAYFKTKSAREAFKSAFEIVGGLPRLAHWADKNYDTFLRLFARQLSTQSAGDSPDEPLFIEMRWGDGGRFGHTVEGEVVPAHREPPTNVVQLELPLTQ